MLNEEHLFLHRALVWFPASTSAVSRSPVTPAPGNLTSSSGLQGQVTDIDVNKNENRFLKYSRQITTTIKPVSILMSVKRIIDFKIEVLLR